MLNRRAKLVFSVPPGQLTWKGLYPLTLKKKVRLLPECTFVLTGRKICYSQDYQKSCGLWPGCSGDSCHNPVVRGPSWDPGKKKDILTMFMIMQKMPMERIFRLSVMLCCSEVIPFTQSSLEMTFKNGAFLVKILPLHIRNHINFM